MKMAAMKVLRVIVLAYLGMILYLSGCQKSFIYYPNRAAESDLLAMAAYHRVEPWRDAEERIIGWFRKDARATTGANRVVVFHGNAGYAQHRTYFADGFQARPDSFWDVYIFEYPGYGARPGSPSEKSITSAAESAVRLLLDETDAPLYLVGESLGSGAACHLARTFPDRVRGLFLVTPFTSLVDVARHHYPVFPVRLLLRERYDNITALQAYRGRIAVMLAGRDEVDPARFGQALYDAYDGPKQLWVQEDRRHNTLDLLPSAPWWRDVTVFLTKE